MSKLAWREEVIIDGKRIACLFRKGDKSSVLFIHGFGSSKNTFIDAFKRKEFGSSTLLAVDLVGFGDSDKPADFSYQFEDQAMILQKLLDQLNVDTFHIVAHSMGGIVGIELAGAIPQRVCSFINVEGNITREDCTMSGSVAKMSGRQFEQEGFEKLKHALAEESKKSGNSALAGYLRDFAKATPKSLHRSALATVQASTSGKLLTRFSSFPFYKCYVYGEKNRGIFPAEQRLRQRGIPLFYVSDSGHSMMTENPEVFYSVIANVITQNTRKYE
jgi:pimeloyl-ACP methyl ester carboxylesterase